MPLFYFLDGLIYMEIPEQIQNFVEEIIEEQYFVVDILFINKKPKGKLTIIMDGDRGISVDVCAAISRQLAAIIDEKDLIKTPFVLEVSSPGVDRPLKMKRQYTNNIGRLLEILLTDGTQQKGMLKEVHPDNIVIEIKRDKKKNSAPELVEVPWEEIQRAKVLISFGK